jgi:hypothetical protein
MKKRVSALLIVVLALGITTARAQVAVAAEGTASAIHYNGTWTAGTEDTESFPLIYWGAQKGNIFSLGAREIIAPGVFNVYGGLGNYQPDLSSLFKNTTLNPDQFNLSFDVVGGVATLSSGGTQGALEGRVNFQIALTSNASFTGGYAGGGIVGGKPFGIVSAGFSYLFGDPSATPSLARHRFLAKRAKIAAAARQ